MNSNLYVLNYNNYYNRIVKRLDTLDEYMTYSTGITIESCSFNPNDGVTTSHYFKSNIKQFNGDYLLETQVNTQGIEQIKSRWFILEVRRERVGGWTLTLQRDIVADKYDAIIEAPVFIEKATVGLNDSAIFNSENMTFNEIKTKETLLKDGTNSSWIALYFAQDTEIAEKTVTLKGDADIDLTTIDHTAWQYYGLVSKPVKPSNLSVGILFEALHVYADYLYNDYNGHWYKYETPVGNVAYGSSTKNRLKILQNSINENAETIITNTLNDITSEKGWLNSFDASIYNNKLIAFRDGYYRCKIIESTTNFAEKSGVNLTSTYSNLKSRVETIFNTTGVDWRLVQNETGYAKLFSLKTTLKTYTVELTLESANNKTYSYKIPQGHNRTEDQPFDIVMIPYDSVLFRKGGGASKSSQQNVSLLVAKDIIENNKGSSKLIDAQIVPYFPRPDIIIKSDITDSPKINLDAFVENTDYNVITDSSNKPVSFIWYVQKASFTNRLSYDCGSLDVRTVSLFGDEYDIKCAIETQKLRICSPNYNGIFEFQPIKAGINTSTIDFDIDCTYMPQTPYIHVSPVFNGRLYGGDFDDARGLICGGDFSMAQSSDQWETYKAQNKNYQIAFNRQVENIEINNSVQRINEVASTIVGSAQGVTSGAMTGAMVGGPYGAAAGAIVGGAAAVGGGIADIVNNEKLRQEALDYTKDQFGYQLGNIKALPDSLVKLPAQTYNNKYFPFVEYYTCTDEEKEALKNKIKYNGMTIMRIGSISDFILGDYSYIKGQLIRLEDTGCDSHEVMYIASELNKGIFIK